MIDQQQIDRYEMRCREKGLALTVQRRVILRELIGRNDHPTADQIYNSVQDRLPGLSKTTVYRVLETLVQVGAARKVSNYSAVVRFDPNVRRHHHLVCEQCGDLTDLEDEAVKRLALPKTHPSGFSITDYSINFTGTCSGCLANS